MPDNTTCGAPHPTVEGITCELAGQHEPVNIHKAHDGEGNPHAWVTTEEDGE